MYVNFAMTGPFVSSFAVEWNGGESDRTKLISEGETTTIDLSKYNLPDSTSCWARAYIQGLANHDSGDNFDYNAQSQQTAYYELTGGWASPSFQYNGIH